MAGIGEVTGFSALPVNLPSAEVTPTDEGRKRGLPFKQGETRVLRY